MFDNLVAETTERVTKRVRKSFELNSFHKDCVNGKIDCFLKLEATIFIGEKT